MGCLRDLGMIVVAIIMGMTAFSCDKKGRQTFNEVKCAMGATDTGC